jgi:hypothetical protein
MPEAELGAGYWRAYERFCRWRSIARGAARHDTARGALRHLAYAVGWKKLAPLWDAVIRARRLGRMLPALEAILHGFGRLRSAPEAACDGEAALRPVEEAAVAASAVPVIADAAALV